jgi:hypothetical protein
VHAQNLTDEHSLLQFQFANKPTQVAKGAEALIVVNEWSSNRSRTVWLSRQP